MLRRIDERLVPDGLGHGHRILVGRAVAVLVGDPVSLLGEVAAWVVRDVLSHV